MVKYYDPTAPELMGEILGSILTDEEGVQKYYSADGIEISISNGNQNEGTTNSWIADNKIVGNNLAFAAIKEDGSVVTWGNGNSGGNSSGVADQLSSNVKGVFGNGTSFAALKEDGSVVTWGHAGRGGDSSSVADLLTSFNQ